MNKWSKILPEYKEYSKYPSDYLQGYEDGYNECLDDVINKLLIAELEGKICFVPSELEIDKFINNIIKKI